MLEAKLFDLSNPTRSVMRTAYFTNLPRTGEFINLSDAEQDFRVYEVKMLVHGDGEPAVDIYVAPSAEKRPWIDLADSFCK